MLFVTNYECFVINQQSAKSNLAANYKPQICSEF